MPESLFSLPELRSLTRLESPTPNVHADALEALVEAVEAARTLRSWQRQWEPEHRGMQDIKSRLDEKLEVFGEL